MSQSLARLLESPLVQSGTTGNFVRALLAEAGRCGMPLHTIALLADLAAMLGIGEPLPDTTMRALAGPVSMWRSHPDQPTHDNIVEVLELASHQRALLAFGGGPPGHMVGTAEIVVAMGNTAKGLNPEEFFEVFTWAAVDVLRQLTGDTADEIRAGKSWKLISDDDVLRPSGRLYETYQTTATTIRREAIKQSRRPTRDFLRPVAAEFRDKHRVNRELALSAGELEIAKATSLAIDRIEAMFPGLESPETEFARFRRLNVEGRGFT